MSIENENIPNPTDSQTEHQPEPTPPIQGQVGDIQQSDTEQTVATVRRMTYQDRVDSYDSAMAAYKQWQSDGKPGGIYRIPKHPDVEDEEYEARRESTPRTRSGGVQLIAGHILIPKL